MNLIYRHPKSFGELWQGGIKDVVSLKYDNPNNINTIALMAFEFQEDLGLPEKYNLLRLPLWDDIESNENRIDELVNKLDILSDQIIEKMMDGYNVLSSCQAGINRSHCASASTVMKLTGWSSVDVSEHVNKNRGLSLCNPVFAEILAALERKLNGKSN